MPQTPEGVVRYEIDLTNGATPGASRFSPRDRVQIVFSNKNPFLFDYDFTILEEVVEEPALSAFLDLFQSVPAPAIPPIKAKTAAPPAGGTAGPQSTSGAPRTVRCPSDQVVAAIKDLVNTEAALLATYGQLKLDAEGISDQFKSLKKKVEGHESTLADPLQRCTEVVNAGRALTGAIDASLQADTPGNLADALKKFDTGVEDLGDDVKAGGSLPTTLREKLRAAGCIGPDLDGFDEQADKLKETLAELKESLGPKSENGLGRAKTDFQKSVQEARDKSQAIAAVLQPGRFHETRFVGDYDDIMRVEVKVSRKKKDEKAFPSSPYLVKKLHFGGRPRFALAAGAAFSTLDNIDYGDIQGVERKPDGEVVLDKDGKPVISRVVGVEDKADQTVTPLILLHTRFAEGKGSVSGFHFSFGFAGNTANNGINLDYLVGLSASFAEERFFVTVGAYNGRTETLRDGFYQGQPLAAAFTEDPSETGRDWDFGFALTYKFR